jgi:serine/threonine protein kinase/tetratricopeptide (TPR) repeat protein
MAEDNRRFRPDGHSPTYVGGKSAVRFPGSGSSDLLPPSADSVASSNPPSPPADATSGSDLPTLVDYGSDSSPLAGSLNPAPIRTPVPSSLSGEQAMLQIGAVLAQRYEILQVLGEGGMGAVYKAHDREIKRTVALKVIRPDLARNPSIVERFKQELRLSHQVTHRNVIRIYDLGEGEGVKFITMEYIAGKDLRSLIRGKKKLTPEEAVDVIQQVCQALEAAHSVGVIHRDLKPQNIMQDESGRILVMDFGLARTLEGDGMTQTGALVGTMEYMSPEQALGKDLDQRSDIFTLGLIFYELLTGKVPFVADSVLASLIKRTQERAAPVSDIDAQIPGALSGIVSKCLERDLDQRYQSVSAILADLDTWRDKRAAATINFGASVKPWGQTLPWPLLTGIVTVLILAISGYLLRDRLWRPSPSAHIPVSVLVADFQNNTSDTLFDDTLEPMVNVALEGASFINAYNRSNARQLAAKLPNPTNKLDEKTARVVAVNQGVSAIVTGSLSRRDNGYSLSMKAIDTVTGKILASGELNTASKDDLLLAVPQLAAPIRKALGDTTPESVQVEKTRGALTVASLEVVHQYGIGMDQLFAGNSEEALRSFSNAIALDPNFARAYAGMAAASGNLGKTQDAEKYAKLAMEHVDRMTERERYRVRGFYYFTTWNWQKCIEEYGDLLRRFPADDTAQTNLAGCYSNLRKFPEAIAAAQRAVEIVPKGAMPRVILSLYSSYGGDFAVGEREAQTALGLNPSFPAYLALVEAQLGLGKMSRATETYHKLEKVNAVGASLAASGLADVASYEGRYADAVRILEQGIAADQDAKNADSAAEKLAALAQLQLLRGQKGPAVAAATKALSMSQSVPVRVLAARTLLDAGEIAKAQKLADSLASELQAETQAYGKIIRGDLALQRGEKNEAIKMFTDANQLLDTWIGRFELGRAYLEAGLFVEADSEFDRCVQRRGEALEIFMDNVPTIAYFPMVHYYQGRVRQGLKSPGFGEPYRAYLSIRGRAGEDPLLADIRRRLGP